MARHALYGNVSIVRGYCSHCRSYAFVLEGKYACCDSPCGEEEPERKKRMSDCAFGRARPSKLWQLLILREQMDRCFYCNRRFNEQVYRHCRGLHLRLQWDHVNPHAYSLDNRDQNFVAACHVCNGIKSSLMFRSADEARTYITQKWKDKGYTDVCPVRVELRRETGASGLLQPEVQAEGMV